MTSPEQTSAQVADEIADDLGTLASNTEDDDVADQLIKLGGRVVRLRNDLASMVLPSDIAVRPSTTHVSTSCGKDLDVRPNRWGSTYLTLSEPATAGGRTAHALWANLSPLDVAQLVDGLLAAVPAARDLMVLVVNPPQEGTGQ